jgi:alpha-tubulin suppressor-like RCC1 family protein
MKSRAYVRWTALALLCCVFTSWSASIPITYPNQASSYYVNASPSTPVPGGFNVKAVAVEGERILAVTRDGRVLATGFPSHWLTNGVLDGITNAVSVGLNYTGGAVLTADGRVIELGRDSSQLPMPELTNAIAIDVSGQFNDDDLDYKLAVTSDGRVVVWGLYEFWYPPSAEIPGVITAAGGWNHIVALKGDGTVVEWDIETPPAVVPGLSNVVAVTAGGEHSVALKADGTVVAWGQNFFGQTDVPAGLSNVVAISAAEDHTLALKSDGTLVAWGRSYFGGDVTPPTGLSNVLAIATSGTRNVVITRLPGPPPISYPNQVYTLRIGVFGPVSNAFNVKAVALEGTRVLAVKTDGRVVTSDFPPNWLADGTVERLTNVVSVGMNYTGGAALTADGRVIELGNLSEHQPEVTNAIAIDVSGQFNDDDSDFKLAVTSDGRVVVWGIYEFGAPPSADIPGVITAAGGWSHIVALKGDGTVVQWDVNNPPTVVAGLSNVVAVAAGGEHSAALKSDGTVVAWGQNFFGQTDVPDGLSNVVAISAAEYHTLALKSDGTLAAWGRYYLGESVTPPPNLSNVVAIATSASRDALIVVSPQPPTLGITPGTSGPGKAIISLYGESNRIYVIESSTNMVTWSFVRNVTSPTGSTSFEVETANPGVQFYRAR